MHPVCFGLSSHLFYHSALGGVLCATQQVLISCLFFCTVEANTTLQSDYLPIKMKFLKDTPEKPLKRIKFPTHKKIEMKENRTRGMSWEV